MEVYAPFYGSVGSSQAISIPQHYTADGTKPSHDQSRHRNGESLNQSKAKKGKKFKTVFSKLKKKSKKKKKGLAVNGFHESVSRTSSYGSCSSSSSNTSLTEETTASFINDSHQCTTSSCREEPAKKMSRKNRKQEQSSVSRGAESADLTTSGKYFKDATSEEYERRDEWKKQSKSKNLKDNGQKNYQQKRQRLDSSAHEETQRNRNGGIKGFWNKIRKPKKKNKIREANNLSQLYVEYDELKGVMTTNCGKLLKRNDNLEDLQDRGEKLVRQCEVFSRHANKIKNKHASWWIRMRDAIGRLCCCFGYCCRAKK